MLQAFTASVFCLQSNTTTLAQITQSLGASPQGKENELPWITRLLALLSWPPTSEAISTSLQTALGWIQSEYHQQAVCRLLYTDE